MRILSLIFLAPFIALAQAKPQHPDGLELAEFATYPQMGNPVAIDVAADGRVFVAEQYRFNRGTEENRTSGFLLEDDLQIQTLDDRQAMYEKWAERYEGGMAWYSRYTDQIRLLTDSDRDGRADRSQIFASFNEPLDGLAAGVLAHGDDVWVTCVPHLWRFRDADRDGSPESSERVHTGFGVRASYLGHDLHGLVIGPDNRLYFSVGDRGFHVELQDGTVLHGPDEGGIFRCQMDGSNLELIHRGLRNPQEIVFDEWGNLFADDNNCDKGDKSRLVQVIDGGNSGWRMHYQTLVGKYPAGPWLAEDIWKRDSERAPLWHTRPADYLGAGPSGMTFSAVGAWPEALRNRFFYCNY
ncbi:MAG: quinoprotein glucose dehydrogenase, partial [Rhodothermales bacterium]